MPNRANPSMMTRSATLLFLLVLLVALAATVARMPRAASPPGLAQGPGGPILVITPAGSASGDYYAEILRNEGLNAFTVADTSAIDASVLAAYDVVILAKTSLTPGQVTILSQWVTTAGGNLIAMAPDPQLSSLLGLSPLGTSLSEGYLLVDTSTVPGNGIAGQTMQYHGSADRYTLNGATALATLYSGVATSTPHPAVTLNAAGIGQAAAFTYDLATSVIRTRQGNPAWAAQERDGFTPIRSDDKFFGNAASDPQPDWVDLANRAAVPQADEQQRLLANLIQRMNQNRKPLPRFWYLPRGKKAVVIMSGDDHGNGGTGPRFDQFKARSAPGCSVADWECVRGTSYIYPSTPLTDAQAAAYTADGFEVGLHINTGCADFTPTTLNDFYNNQVAGFRTKYSSIPAPSTQRHHCIVWSDWSTAAEVQVNNGMRLDTSYYFWPPAWVNNVPGLMTGSAMPMRFAAPDGALIDVYMAATQMTDESGQIYPFTVDTLLDRALGPEGYYGVYTVNAHTDAAVSAEADAVVTSAQARGVPIVSSLQMLRWLDGRNASSFTSLAWNGSALSFGIAPGLGANGLQAMLPTRFGNRVLASLTRAGSAVSFDVVGIKGVEYASFAGAGGSYVATYSVDTAAPSVVSTSQTDGATGVPVTASVKATFSEAMDPSTIGSGTFELRNAAGALVTAGVAYDAASRVATVSLAQALASNTTYTATLKGGASGARVRDAAANPLAANMVWSFTTAGGATCPCTAWPASSTPTTAANADPGPVELGVRFTVDQAGYITGIRFYKGSTNTGTHVATLWSATGAQLARTTFTGESPSGWQQVDFPTPVAVSANTVYVASYFAPQGNYAGDNFYFANSGVDRSPVHLLRDGVSGGNGLYAYAASPTLPTSTYQSTNYWVDVVFNTALPSDTTPPTITATAPASGATGVPVTSSVSATFSEVLDPATVNGSSFVLVDSAGAGVAAGVGYDAASRTATLTPTAPLTSGKTYTAIVKGGVVKDAAGNALAADASWSFTTTAATGICAAPPNPIVAENCLPGAPASEWDISGAGDTSIQGYATDISVNRGSTVSFKVATGASNYRFDIYRLGYYSGSGARKVATVAPSAALPQAQPACLTDAATGLLDCGNWAVSGSWAVPASAVSGIYVARVVRTDTGGASHIVFVVRDDSSTSDLLFQTSDTTWQAYNNYGGNNLYNGTAPAGRAYKVSYNRPFNTRAVDNGQDWLFNAEYPMLRWLEANGYSVSYSTGMDTERNGSLLLNHRVFLSVGHDEYWSAGQRANVEAARQGQPPAKPPVHLAFISGNEIFWKTRWEPSIDGSSTPYRTLVSYKETHANARIDPLDPPTWTGTWRDPRFSVPPPPMADGGRPENALSGTLFMVNDGATTAMKVPAADGKMRFWRNTNIATQAAGATATLAGSTVGYEWDIDADNGFRPPGLIRLSTTTVANAPVLTDYGSTYGSATAVHSMTLYRHASGALVFGAGTVQWPWGLDASHDRTAVAVDSRMRQATVNLFADMGVQPGSLQSGLVAASPSTDTVAPVSVITSPSAGASLTVGTAVTITGTASDSGGGVVGGVEVSVDNGATWRRATGRASWSYAWTPTAVGSVTIRSRAADDSVNLETPGAGVTVTVGDTTPPTVRSTAPASGATNVARGVNVTATFSEAMKPATINGSTFWLKPTLNPTGPAVSATVSYNTTSNVATLDPAANLAPLTRYTATVKGGAGGVQDLAGNPLASDRTWTFTTR